MKKKLVTAAILMLISLAAVSTAEVTITTAVGNGADGGITNDGSSGPAAVGGAATSSEIRRYDGVRARAVVLRFDISSLTGQDLGDAILSINVGWTANRSRTMNIYGMADGADDLWAESTLSHNTTPGLVQVGDPGYALNVIQVDNDDWTLIGTMPFASGPALNSGPIDLAGMIAADTNGLLTLLVYTSTSDSSQDWTCVMKENTNSIAPSLTFPNARPVGSSFPQPEADSVTTDLNLASLCWESRNIARCAVWFGSSADANELDYAAKLTPMGTIDNPAGNTCIAIPAGMKPLAVPAAYTWAVENYVYPEWDPGHTGEPNQLAGISIWHFSTTDLPVLISNPESQYTFQGQSAVFSATFESAAPITNATWYKVGSPDTAVNPAFVSLVDEGGRRYATALTLSSVTVSDEGSYYCVVQNAANTSTSASADLVVKRMLAHWAFDGNATDATGAYNGTLVGDPNYITDASRQVLKFKGSGEAVDLPDGFADFRAGLTFQIWTNPTESTSYAPFISLGNEGTSDLVHLWRAFTTGAFRFEVLRSTVSGGIIQGGAFTINEWQLMTVTLDASGQAVIYRNGVPAATGTTYVPNVIVRTGNLIANGFVGMIDDFKVYNYPLTQDEIAQVYADSAGSFCRYKPAYDYNNNCIVDLGDFAVIAARWLQCGLYPDSVCP